MSDFTNFLKQQTKQTDTKDGEGEFIFFTLLFLFVIEKITNVSMRVRNNNITNRVE